MNKIKEIINETKRIKFFYRNKSRKFAKNKLLEKGYKHKNIRRAFQLINERNKQGLIYRSMAYFSIIMLFIGAFFIL